MASRSADPLQNYLLVDGEFSNFLTSSASPKNDSQTNERDGDGSDRQEFRVP